MKPLKVSKYVITNGENYVANSLGTSFKVDKEDAYMWSTESAANNVLINQMSNKKSYLVKEITVYKSDIAPDITMDVETIQNFLDVVMDSAEHEEELRSQLRKTDRSISDILHYIEMTDLNARDGYMVYKQLKAYQRSRREIKNRLKIVESVNSLSIDPQVLKSVISFFKERSYRPRELDFDDMW